MPRGRWKICPKRWQASPTVDDRLHLVHVIADHPKEQRFITVVQCVQRDIPVERIGHAPQLLQRARHLLFLRMHTRRKQTAQAERVALFLGERGSLVGERVVQQGHSVWLFDLCD